MSEPRPKVSVVMITYNHEKYIEQAVNSVLMQETDFDYEIIIGEDCSTDRTREILIELQKQHPDKIRLVLNPQNLGMIPNFVNVLGMARGEYIALLEGDDYWIHPQKLRIQVDYMEIHTECRICTHNVRIVDASDRVLGIRGYQNVKGLEEYLKAQNFIVTSSMLLRRPDRELPDWFLSLKSAGDWPLHIWLLMQGGGSVALRGHLCQVGGFTAEVWLPS